MMLPIVLTVVASGTSPRIVVSEVVETHPCHHVQNPTSPLRLRVPPTSPTCIVPERHC